MKTKYELFLEHLIHGIDEPQRTFKKHHQIGFPKNKFELKGKLLSATKIFLGDDFANKQFPEWSRKAAKKVSSMSATKKYETKKNIRAYHGEIFQNSLPLYDNMLILFPYSLKNAVGDDVEGEFMAGCWIQKHDFHRALLSTNINTKSTYRISTFDNACKFHGYKERLNLSFLDYLVDFDGGILPSKEDVHYHHVKAKENFFRRLNFGEEFKEPIKESMKSFLDFLPSSMLDKKYDIDKFANYFRDVNEEEWNWKYSSQLCILTYLNLLQFINSKGSETIAFKSNLPIKKRSNVLKGFEYKMLEVKKANTITTRYGDSINKNRLHWVRRHTREYKNGKTITINPHQRGDEKMGVIIKDYNFK